MTCLLVDLEQVEAYANQDGKSFQRDDMFACLLEMPRYNQPSKILCNVVSVQLKVNHFSLHVFNKMRN